MAVKDIRELISSGRLGDALKSACEELPNYTQNETTQLQSQFQDLEKEARLGIIDTDEAARRRAKISYALLQLLSKLETDNSKNEITQIHHGSGDNVAGSKIIFQESSKEPVPPSEPLKTILFAAANPSNEARIQTDLEHRTIKEEIQKGTHRGHFNFLPTQLAVRITELMRAFKSTPTIIHFAGHGVEAGILVSNDQNEAQLLSDTTIQRLFKPLKGKTELVLLNSCYSAYQAELISKMGMIVIGHNLPIGDDAAVSFSKGFYLGLSEGLTYEDAFNDGITTVLAENEDYASVIEVWKDGERLAW
jgi:ribosomal protein S20